MEPLFLCYNKSGVSLFKKVNEMKHMKKRLISGITALLMIISMPAAAFAEELEITDGSSSGGASSAERETSYFNVDVQVKENNSYEFTETIGTVFNTPGHGIYRNVPTEFDGITEEVTDGWCSSDPVQTYTEGGYYVMQMGSGEKYINGEHEFTIGYRLTMRDDRDTSGDYMYIDVLPVDWQTPIGSSEVTIHMPKKINKNKISVYVGKYGTEGNPVEKGWTLKDGRTIKIKAQNLEKGVGITVLARMPEGYWVGQNNPTSGRTAAILICILAALAFAGLWLRFGKKQNIVETVEFHPPEGITPAEIGLIIDGTLDKKDMVSMFMYFAQKGYMTIKEEKKGFEFTKLKDIGKGEKKFARVLFDATFEDGDTVNTRDLGSGFGYSYLAACDVVNDEYGEIMPKSSAAIQRLGGMLLYVIPVIVVICAAMYALRPDGTLFGAAIVALASAFLTRPLKKSYRNRMSGKKSGKKITRIIYWVIDAVLLLMAAVGIGSAFDSGAMGLLFFVAFGICQASNVYFGKLSNKVYKYIGQVLGLKNFIKTAEIDRINQLVEEDPEYFYDILPYAYVMGLTNKWVKKFENIKTDIPSWYQTQSTGTYIPAIYMGDALGDMTHSVAAAVPSLIPSGSIGGLDSGGGFSGGGGGFSGGGGGFSGGGAGGGGGGFW